MFGCHVLWALAWWFRIRECSYVQVCVLPASLCLLASRLTQLLHCVMGLGSGFVAVIVTNLVIAAYAYMAYTEDPPPAEPYRPKTD